MILADKIMNERKKNGWSQEELAEKLSVSRQSVSKWEGAQAVPDLQKIIAMSEVFGVSIDYLLKDEVEVQEPQATAEITLEDSRHEPPLRKVSMEETNEYLHTVKKTTPALANAVMLCIYAPIILIVLAGLSEGGFFGISEETAAGIGLLALFGCIAFAVYQFIITGSKLDKYKFLEYENIDTGYGVSGMVKQKKEEYQDKYIRFMALGVILCVISVVPLIVGACMMKLPENTEDAVMTALVGLLLLMVGAGVNMIIRVSCIMESYKKLLEEGDFDKSNKRHEKKRQRVHTIYWSLVTAIYLAVSFYNMQWDVSWIVWPVAAVLFPVCSGIAELIWKEN